ncbi:hypothetical protein D3C71_2134430 [compost metagenome]
MWETAFWVASENTGMPRPSPNPNTIILNTAIPTLFMTTIIPIPTTIIGTPIKAYRLYLPLLAINCPAIALVMTITIDIGIVT